jgi:hypothetical protein
MGLKQIITGEVNGLKEYWKHRNDAPDPIDPYWTKIHWGYVPAYVAKDRSGEGSNREFANSTWAAAHGHATKGMAFTGAALGHGIREYNSGRMGVPDDARITGLLRGSCDLCHTDWLVPIDRELDYFSCPRCLSDENYRMLKILFFEREDGAAYHKCPSCGNHADITIEHHSDRFDFSCAKCDGHFTLKRSDKEIELLPYSDLGGFFACGFCGRIFVSMHGEGEPVICTRCGASGLQM